MRKVFLPVALAALAAGCGKAEGPKQATRPARVERGDVTLTVSATGEITPLRQIELKSKASGQVVRFPKLEGQPVAADELLAELEKRLEARNLEREAANQAAAEARLSLLRLEYARALTQAESELASAQEDARVKRSDVERLEKLRDVTAETELTTARLGARLADEKVKQAEAALALARDRKAHDERLAEAEVVRARLTVADARERLADTEVRSPIEGILLKRLVEEGQIVSSGISAVSGGTPIAIVADVSTLLVLASVDETDIGKLQVGQEAWVTVEAHPEKRFAGRVAHIPPKGEIESSIIVFKVRIALEGKNFGALKAGMTATVTVKADERSGVLCVPSEAVRSEGGKRYVFARDGQRRIDVKTGLDDGTRCEILEGLNEGDEIAIVTAARSSTAAPAGAPMRRMR